MTKNVFPRHDIDPSKKDGKWRLQYVKAAWEESKGHSSKIFYHGQENFRRLVDYSNGNQSISLYKTMFEPKDANDRQMEKFVQLDYTIVPIIPKFKKIALGKLNKIKHNIVATAIDSLARDEEEDYFAEQRAKIDLLEQLKDVPGIEQMIGIEDGEPHTLEEIKIKREYSYKHQAAIEIEQGLKLIFSNNKYEEKEDKVREDIFNVGVGGIREYFNENGVIKARRVKPWDFISSYCEEDDFSDARYLGEVLKMTAEDVRRESGFSEEVMEEIVKASKSVMNYSDTNFQRPSKPYDDEKITVLDLEFKSLNERVHVKRVNSSGNKDVRKTDFWREDKKTSSKEYSRMGYQVIYKAKWVVGTEYIFQDGLETNMKRSKNSLRDTSFSFHMYAPSQDQMRFFGVVESMIPVADQIQIAWLKLQNLILNIVPPGIAFDLSALDNINLGSAGEKWKPMKVLELYRQRGDFPYRSRTEEGDPFSQVPITPIQNQVMNEVQGFISLINSHIQLMRDSIGFNEMTDGSTPDPRMLNGVANMAYQNTSNALAHIIKGIKYINQNVASGICLRMQDSFGSGKIKGYMTALGVNTQRFFAVNSDISVHEMSIDLEDRPSDEDINNFNQKIQLALQSNQITVADSVYLDTIDNMKERSAVLAYFVKKRDEQRQAEQMQQIQANGQTQQQSAMVAEEEKRKTLEFEYSLKMQFMQTQEQLKYQTEELKQRTRLMEAELNATGKIQTKRVENEGKREVKSMEEKNPTS